MDVGSAVKHVPKWAYIAGGGVVVGSVVLRHLKSNSAAAPTAPGAATAADANSAVDPYGTGNYGSAAIVVPPVTNISQGSNDYTGALAQQFIDGTNSVLSTLLDLPGTVLAGVQTGSDITSQGVVLGQQGVISGMTAGGAPASNGAAGVVTASTPAQPNATPTPAAPAPSASVPPAPTSTAPKPCGGTYPYRNPANGKCYYITKKNIRGSDHYCYQITEHHYQDGTSAIASRDRVATWLCP